MKGKIRDIDLLLCICGIGKVNASIASALVLSKFPVKRVIIAGIAGAYPSSGLQPGDIAIAEKEINADEGLLISFEEKDDSFKFLNCDEVKLFVPEFCKDLRQGTFLTVSACTGNLSRARFLEKRFNAICENMEGYAIAKAAQIFEIQSIEIRSISNMVTNRSELLKTSDIKIAAEVLQEFLIDRLRFFMY